MLNFQRLNSEHESYFFAQALSISFTYSAYCAEQNFMKTSPYSAVADSEGVRGVLEPNYFHGEF